MNAYEIPNLRFSLPCGGDVLRRRFVTVDATGKGVLAAAGASSIGVSMNQAANGEVLEVSDGIVMVEASALINAGANVSAATGGKAVTTADTAVILGMAITGATAAGQFVAVKLR